MFFSYGHCLVGAFSVCMFVKALGLTWGFSKGIFLIDTVHRISFVCCVSIDYFPSKELLVQQRSKT